MQKTLLYIREQSIYNILISSLFFFSSWSGQPVDIINHKNYKFIPFVDPQLLCRHTIFRNTSGTLEPDQHLAPSNQSAMAAAAARDSSTVIGWRARDAGPTLRDRCPKCLWIWNENAPTGCPNHKKNNRRLVCCKALTTDIVWEKVGEHRARFARLHVQDHLMGTQEEVVIQILWGIWS